MGGRTSGSFKPGHPGGPGKPRIPDDIKRFKAQTKWQFEELLCEYLHFNQSEIHKIHTSPTASMLELICARFLQQLVNHADVARFNALADRILGPIPKVLEVDLDDLNSQNPASEKEVKQIDGRKLLSLMLQLKDKPPHDQCQLTAKSLQQESVLSQACSAPPPPTES